jgi:hypothetical protein
MGVINSSIGATRLMGNVHNLCRVSKTVITAVLIVMSGPKRSQNKWSLISLFMHDDYDDFMMMFHYSIGSVI